MTAVLRALSIVLALLALPMARAAESSSGPRLGYWYASVGNFAGDETPGQLEGEGSSYGAVVGLGLPRSEHFAVDGEIGAYSSKYNTPPLTAPFGGSVDARMRVTSAGFAINAKAFSGMSRSALYAGAGIGLFWSDLTVTGTIFGLPATRTETDMAPGYQFIGGGEIAISRDARLGVEYRRVFLKANFGDLSGGTVDVGGRYVALTFRQTFAF